MEEQKEKLLRQYLDGELSEEREQEALHMIADDPEMRAMLQFEFKWRDSSRRLSGSDSFRVPENFSQDVMNTIESRESRTEEVNKTSVLRDIKNAWRQFWQPRPIAIRPAYVTIAVVLVAMIFAVPYLTNETEPTLSLTEKDAQQKITYKTAASESEQVWTRFVYIDKEAESVAVAGDFSDWEPIALTKKKLNGQVAWTGLVPMNRGEHRYMFVKNGEKWISDPLASNYEDDGFGNKNAVIHL